MLSGGRIFGSAFKLFCTTGKKRVNKFSFLPKKKGIFEGFGAAARHEKRGLILLSSSLTFIALYSIDKPSPLLSDSTISALPVVQCEFDERVKDLPIHKEDSKPPLLISAPCPHSNNAIDWFWLKWLSPDFPFILLSCICTIIASIYRPSIRSIFVPGTQRSFEVSRLGYLCISIALSSLMTFAAHFWVTLAADGFMHRARQSIFKQIIGQDLAFYSSTASSQTHALISMLTKEVVLARSNLKQFISNSTLTLTQTIISVYEMFLISPQITAWVVLALFPGIYGIGILGQEYLRSMRNGVRDAETEYGSHIKQCLDNVKTVKAMNAEQQELEITSSLSSEILSRSLSFNLGLSAFLALSSLTVSSMTLGLAFWLMNYNSTGTGELIQVASFLESLQNLQKSFGMLGLLLSQWGKLKDSAANLVKYMNLTPSIERPFDPDHQQNHALTPISRIELKNVSFKYNPSDPNYAITNLNAKFERGKMVAICGASGSGKSTVASILERFYQPSEGVILVDSKPLEEINIK